MMCVTDTKAVTEIVTKTNGIRDGAAAGKILIDHSSIEPDATRRLATQLRAEKGMHWIDAPVSGGIAGAEAGKLVVMAGGEEADIEKVRPIVANYALRLTHMGPVGAGQVTKLCNQVIVGGTIAVVAEALMLAANGGVDPARLPECLAGGYADSPVLQNHGRRMASGELTPLGGTGDDAEGHGHGGGAGAQHRHGFADGQSDGGALSRLVGARLRPARPGRPDQALRQGAAAVQTGIENTGEARETGMKRGTILGGAAFALACWVGLRRRRMRKRPQFASATGC